jgi:hypothetical protein
MSNADKTIDPTLNTHDLSEMLEEKSSTDFNEEDYFKNDEN